MRALRSPLLTAALLLLWLGSGLAAKDTGVILGKVFDRETQQPLPAAAVRLVELAIGDIAQSDGSFRIAAIRSGRYTVEARLIGYKVYRRYDVRVSAVDTLHIDIYLEPTVLPMGEEVVVIGKRPLLDLNQPSSGRSIGREELALLPAPQLKDVLQEQPGIVVQDNELHIRGGRTYESDFLIDGVSVFDPLLRQGYALNPNPQTVEEIRITSGGLSAGYGGATSGVVELVTREGSDSFVCAADYRTDNFGFGSSFDFNSDYVDLLVSGQDPVGAALWRSLGWNIRSYLFLSVSASLSDTYLPYSRKLFSSYHGTTFAPRSQNYWTVFLKWHAWLANRLKLTFSHTGSLNIDQDRAVLDTRIRLATYSYGYPFEFVHDLDHYNTFTRLSNQQILRLQSNVAGRTSWDLTLSRFFANLHSDVGGKRWNEYEAPVDTLPYIIQISPDSTYYTIEEGDGFYDGGDGDLWYDHYLETYSLAASLRHQFEIKQTISAGVSYDYQTIQMTDIYKPYLGTDGFGLNYDLYKAYPSGLAAYFQNTFNFSGAVFDFGARLDLWAPGAYAERAALSGKSPVVGETIKKKFEDETSKLFGRRVQSVFSPRFGVSYLLSNNFTLYADYNHLAKRPPPQYVYARLFTPAQGAYQLFGNPALTSEKVTTIEAGIKYLPSPGSALSVSAYIKDISDYIAATQFVPDSRFPQESYLVYFNLDFAKSRGVELNLIQDLGRYVRGYADLTVSRAEGERSLPADILRGLETRAEGALYTNVAFDWDVPWQFSLGTNVSVAADQRPRLLGIRLPSNWDLHLRYSARAGKRYTPYAEVVDSFGVTRYLRSGDTNAKLGPYQSWLNLSLQKHFILRGMKLSFFFEAENLLNHRNVTIINPLTGREYRRGDTIPTGDNFFEVPPVGYRLPIWDNPTQFLAPRTLRLGLGVEF